MRDAAPESSGTAYSLAKLKHTDVESLIGPDPYAKSEEEVIAEYDSARTIPQMIFLGLDEKHAADGMAWKKGGAKAKEGAEVYRGSPLFAIDVTPKGSVVKEVEDFIKKVQSTGDKFLEGRMLLGFEAGEGGPPLVCQWLAGRADSDFRRRHIRQCSPLAGLERAEPLLRRLWPAHALDQWRQQAHLSAKRRGALEGQHRGHGRREANRRPARLRHEARDIEPMLSSYGSHRHNGRGLGRRQ